MVGGLIPSESTTVAGLAGLSWRVASVIIVIISVAPGLDISRSIRFVFLFGPWLVFAIVAELLARSPIDEIVLDIARQAFCIVIGAAVYGSMSRQTTMRTWLIFLSALAILTALLSSILVVPELLHGWSYNAGRDLKTEALQAGGFGVNSVSFAGLIAGVGALRKENPWRRQVVWSIFALAFDSFVLTARAPLAALVIGTLISWWLVRPGVLLTLGRSKMRSLVWAGLIVGLPLLLFLLSIDMIASSSLARELAGRAALWQIAMDSWHKHPFDGTGVRTFTAVIHSNLSAADYSANWERSAVDELTAGGFHNLWINTLAERGLLGLVGLYVSYVLTLALLLRRTVSSIEMNRLGILLVFFFMYLRGYFELGGLFSYGDAPIDALAMICIALVLRPVPFRRRSPKQILKVKSYSISLTRAGAN